MTREEAVSKLSEIQFAYVDETREAFDMAIEALQAEQCACAPLYYFARADAMIDHTFTDDVAITYAQDKAEAIKKFSKLYANVTADEVDPVMFNSEDIAILTDY